MKPSLYLLLLGLSVLTGTASAQYTTPTRPDCGKYATAQWPDGTFSCERYATFPWFAAGQGWQTQVPMFTAPVPPVNGQARGVQFQVGLGPGSSVSTVYGGLSGGYGNFNFVQPPILASQSARLDILSSVSCGFGGCFLTNDLAVGPLWVQMDAPDVQTLEAAGLQLIFIYSDTSGENSWQVAVPPVFNDLAAPKWMTSFSETAVDQKSTAVNSNDSSFAVTNLSDQPQTVMVSLYDQAGNLIIQKATPQLAAGIQNGSQVIPGGVYGDDLADFFGLTTSMLTQDQAALAALTGTIDGTIRFEASNGQPIAPLMVRIAGNSVTSLLVTPIQ